MRLTNTLRDAFVRAVMNDVPKVDYQEQADKIIHEFLDKKFAEVFGDKVTRRQAGELSWLRGCSVRTPGGLSNPYTYCAGYGVIEGTPAWKKLEELAAKHTAQANTLAALEEKLRGAAYAVTTRKALVELLPEFEKYLPSDDSKATKAMLPAVANVVSDFVKAGWPKGKEVTA